MIGTAAVGLSNGKQMLINIIIIDVLTIYLRYIALITTRIKALL
jgi:hypothetical protein